MATAILYSDKYLKHDTGHHPERRERYRAVLDGLMADEDWWQGLVRLAPRPATNLSVDTRRVRLPRFIRLASRR